MSEYELSDIPEAPQVGDVARCRYEPFGDGFNPAFNLYDVACEYGAPISLTCLKVDGRHAVFGYRDERRWLQLRACRENNRMKLEWLSYYELKDGYDGPLELPKMPHQVPDAVKSFDTGLASVSIGDAP